MAKVQKKPLGERLMDLGIISKEQLDLALKEQKRTGEYLGEVLHNLGFVSEDVLSSTLAMQAGVEHVELSNHLIDPEALKLVPRSFAQKNKLIPLSIEGKRMTVAMANTMDVMAMDELQKSTGLYIDVVSATESDILRAIEHWYGEGESFEEIFENTIRQAERGDIAAAEMDTAAMVAPIVRLVDQIIIKAVKDGATDIHLEPEENIVRMRFRIDGFLHQYPSIPKSIQAPVLARIKIMANMNISEIRLPQDGRIRFNMGKKKIDLRVSTFPTIFGENIVLRVLDKSRVILGLEELGFSEKNLEIFKEKIIRPHGIILVAGPTGSGKTTTLYSALSYINSLEKNIMTLEDPIEYELPVIRQSQINVKAGLTFDVGLRSILRQDPDVILIGEMRDYETVEMAVRAALTGHLVFSTLHTNDAPGAIPRLLDMGVEPYLLASSIVAVVAQRLVRKICRKCKVKVRPNRELFDQLKVDEEDRGREFYKGSGCEQCHQTGYKGRTGIFEIFVVTPEIRNLIIAKADSKTISTEARRQGMKVLREDGIQKVLSGITTLEEVLRVSYEA